MKISLRSAGESSASGRARMANNGVPFAGDSYARREAESNRPPAGGGSHIAMNRPLWPSGACTSRANVACNASSNSHPRPGRARWYHEKASAICAKASALSRTRRLTSGHAAARGLLPTESKAPPPDGRAADPARPCASPEPVAPPSILAPLRAEAYVREAVEVRILRPQRGFVLARGSEHHAVRERQSMFQAQRRSR